MQIYVRSTWKVAYLLLLFAFVWEATPARAQDLSQRVLLVYSQNSQDSQNVAWSYAAARGVPFENLCAIAPPSDRILTEPDYQSFVRSPIQQCLSQVGAGNILYIVFSYGTPYLIDRLRGPFALDSYVADIWDVYEENYGAIGPASTHGYYAESQDQGAYFQPFISLSDYRQQPGANLIYSVWRLDGPTPEGAARLVSQAMEAERNGGPSGSACLDENDVVSPFDFGYSSGNWDLHRAAEFAGQAGYAVVEDFHNEEFGTAPVSACPDAALYSGWYSLNHYNDAFTWSTGAIGWHLDSASALDPRGGANWAAGALARGITVTTGAVNEPFLEGMVRPGGAFRNLLEGANVGDAFLRNTRWLKWMILNIGDPLYRPFAGGRAPFNPPAPASSLELQPRFVVGGERTASGIIHLGAPAPPGGLTFALSTDVNVASVPSTVTVAEGDISASFPIQASGTPNLAVSVVNAQSDSITLVNTIEDDPLLGALIVEPLFAYSGGQAIGTVYLNDFAPMDILVNLSSDNSQLAAVPDSIVIPAGSETGTFPVSLGFVPGTTGVNLTASYGGTTAGGQVFIQPGASASSSLAVAPSLIGIGITKATGTRRNTAVVPRSAIRLRAR